MLAGESIYSNMNIWKTPHTTKLADDEVNYFFNTEIKILETTMVKLREKRINRIENLVAFNADDVSSMSNALRKTRCLVPASGGTRADHALTSYPVVRIGAKDMISLWASIFIMKHYEMLNHKPTASHLRCGPVLNNFKLKFDTIKRLKKKEVTVLQIIRKLDIVHWTDSFLVVLSRIVGARKNTLAHVVRTTDDVAYITHFELMNDTYYAGDSWSLE